MPSTFTADELNFCVLPLSASGTPSAGQRSARAEWEQVDPRRHYHRNGSLFPSSAERQKSDTYTKFLFNILNISRIANTLKFARLHHFCEYARSRRRLNIKQFFNIPADNLSAFGDNFFYFRLPIGASRCCRSQCAFNFIKHRLE